MALPPFFAYTVCMKDPVFMKELGVVITIKLLLLFIVWFLFFHQPKAERVHDLRPILLTKDHPA